MSYTVNGTCSLCGGAVTTPTFWWGVLPPTPTCSSCGATPAAPHGPVIPMQPARRTVTTTGTSVQDLQEAIDKHNAVAKHRPQRGMSTTASTYAVSWCVAATSTLDTLRAVGPVQSGTLRTYRA